LWHDDSLKCIRRVKRETSKWRLRAGRRRRRKWYTMAMKSQKHRHSTGTNIGSPKAHYPAISQAYWAPQPQTAPYSVPGTKLSMSDNTRRSAWWLFFGISREKNCSRTACLSYMRSKACTQYFILLTSNVFIRFSIRNNHLYLAFICSVNKFHIWLQNIWLQIIELVIELIIRLLFTLNNAMHRIWERER